ncbi:MAG: hypothetical protein ACJAYF_000670 [Arenicella sp.]|jgi:hypothetical protein
MVLRDNELHEYESGSWFIFTFIFEQWTQIIEQ